MFKLLSLKLKSVSAYAAQAAGALWTFPTIIFSSLVIAWAAEAAQFLFSQGLALAILAWLQTLPEFAVEAVISWEAGKDPAKIHLITANFTGSLRLLVGLGWPLIFFTHALLGKDSHLHKRWDPIDLDDEHCVEVLALLLPLFYFLLIYFKGTLNLLDSVFLTAMYIFYLWLLKKIPPRDAETVEEAGVIPRYILRQKIFLRNSLIAGLFLFGGVLLYFTAHPFLYSMLGMAVALGVSDFVFVQWVAPFLSEFPEKVSAFYWARGDKAPMALMNMVSSNINQWTVLVAMIPVVYSFSQGHVSTIHFDHHQRVEILLTIVQSFLGFLLLANMEFEWFEAVLLFTLWLIQFLFPSTREAMVFVYMAWIAYELVLVLLRKNQLQAFPAFAQQWKMHVKKDKR